LERSFDDAARAPGTAIVKLADNAAN